MSAPAVILAAGLGLTAGMVLEVIVEVVPRRVAVDSWSLDDVHPVRAGVLCLLTAALFGLATARAPSGWELAPLLLLAAALVGLSAIDLEHLVLPNRLVYPTGAALLVLLAAAAGAEGAWPAFGRAVLAGGLAVLVMTGLVLCSPGGLGMGDAKLAGVVGLALGWIGWGSLVAGLFLAFAASAVVGLVLVVTRRRTRHDALAFGPFLALGTLVVLLV